jgi:large subunit ribosomal protein L31
MKTEIHPDYVVARVRCTCGNEFVTRATRDEYHLEICSNCHPFYTGRQKLVDTGGRVERFQRRAALGRAGKAKRADRPLGEIASAAPSEAPAKAPAAEEAPVETTAALETVAPEPAVEAPEAEAVEAPTAEAVEAPEVEAVVEVAENGASDGGSAEAEATPAHSNGATAEPATSSD